MYNRNRINIYIYTHIYIYIYIIYICSRGIYLSADLYLIVRLCLSVLFTYLILGSKAI